MVVHQDILNFASASSVVGSCSSPLSQLGAALAHAADLQTPPVALDDVAACRCCAQRLRVWSFVRQHLPCVLVCLLVCVRRDHLSFVWHGGRMLDWRAEAAVWVSSF